MKKKQESGNASPLRVGIKRVASFSFSAQDIHYTLKDKKLIKQWIGAVIKKKTRKAGDISFIFCSESYLLTLNNQYLKHDTHTDIITFDYSQNDPKLPVSGDIFISVQRVKENALKFSKTFDEELHRVMIHGILHLLGYKDKTKIAKAEMTKEEDLWLKALKNQVI